MENETTPKQPWEKDLDEAYKELNGEIENIYRMLERLETVELRFKKHKHAEGEVVVPL